MSQKISGSFFFMSKLLFYTTLGNFFSILNILAILNETPKTGIFLGIVACVFYIKALKSKRD